MNHLLNIVSCLTGKYFIDMKTSPFANVGLPKLGMVVASLDARGAFKIVAARGAFKIEAASLRD